MPVQALSQVASSLATSGAEWQIGSPGVDGVASGAQGGVQGAGGGKGFGSLLTNSIDSLQNQQTTAAQAAQGLATGQTQDVSSVVMAVERAQLSMQLAAQLRDKATEAYQEIFRTQV